MTGYEGGFGMMGYGGGFGMFFGPLLLIGLVALVIYFLSRTGTGPTSGKTARDILDERFARGEIDEREYNSRRKVIVH